MPSKRKPKSSPLSTAGPDETGSISVLRTWLKAWKIKSYVDESDPNIILIPMTDMGLIYIHRFENTGDHFLHFGLSLGELPNGGGTQGREVYFEQILRRNYSIIIGKYGLNEKGKVFFEALTFAANVGRESFYRLLSTFIGEAHTFLRWRKSPEEEWLTVQQLAAELRANETD